MKTKFCTSSSFVPLVVLLGAFAGLAVMGLVFCWLCPDMSHDVGGSASRWHFKQQVVWNVIGIAAFYAAAAIGWKRWLKAAPFLFEGWVALWFAAHMRQLDGGASTTVPIGPISLDVWTLFPVALALLAAWLRERYGIRIRRILFIIGVVAVTVTAYDLITDESRMNRIVAFFAEDGSPAMSPSACARSFAQCQACKAFTQAKWVSSSDTEILRRIPGQITYSMPASSAVMFGKWFISVAGGFFAVIAFSLIWFWRVTKDRAKQAFVLVAGLGIIVPTVFGVYQCLGIVPMSYMCVPLVSNCTTSVLASWLGAGILASACVGRGEFVWSRAEYLSE